MTRPTFPELSGLLDRYRVIPVCREMYADISTPIALLRKLAQHSDRYYLLESIEGGERWGRYSFLGFDPALQVTGKGSRVTVCDGKTDTTEEADPMEVLRRILKQYKTPRFSYMPPFTGGFVGYFSYEMIGCFEPVLRLQESETNDFDLMLFDKVIAYDHLKQKISIIVNMKTCEGEAGYQKAVDEIERIAAMIRDPAPLPCDPEGPAPVFASNLSKAQFCEMVEKAKAYIRDGDIFQAVLSRKFEAPYDGDLLNAYRVLRTTNPSPYMVFLQTGDVQIAGTSPETLVKLTDGRLSTFPVAGSRPRGKTPAEDEALEAELLADEKELSEHNMLVDLARNDLGRVAQYDTVEVEFYKQVHRYSRIMHIASVVSADIKPEYDACDTIRAILPAGTLSGAPKVRACEIIGELEPSARGVYGGAIGYIDFSGNMDTCISIRMAVKKDGKVTVQAGAGIVADSVPETEYIETENKAGAVIGAILAAGEVND